MRRKKVFLSILIATLSLGVVPSINCQQPTLAVTVEAPTSEIVKSTVSPAPTKAGPRDKPQELLELAVQLAENNFHLRASPFSRAALVMALEKLLDHQCFKKLHVTLGYDKPPTDTACRETIERILSIDSGNPVAVCARDGIDSKLCISSYAAQKIAIFDPAKDPPQGELPDLEVKLSETRYQDKLRQIENDLVRYISEYRKTKKYEFLKGALALLDQALQLSCKVVRISLEDSNANPLPTIAAAPSPSAASEAGTAVPKLTNYSRVRYITRSCAKFINETLRLEKNYPTAVCYRDGQTSPACIGAKRLNVKKEKAKVAATKTSKPGAPEDDKPFVTF